jgi:hypothetical protein
MSNPLNPIPSVIDNLRILITNEDTVVINSNGISNAWLNFTLYFPQFLYRTKRKDRRNRVCDHFTFGERLKDNDRPLGGGFVNTKFLANGENYKTDFIEVDKEDIVEIFKNTEDTNKLLYFNNRNITGYNLKGNYKQTNNMIYFFKGLTSNVNSFLNLIIKKII